MDDVAPLKAPTYLMSEMALSDYEYSSSWFVLLFGLVWSPIPNLMAFTGDTNAHRPSPQPTACRSSSCSVATEIGSNQAQGKV